MSNAPDVDVEERRFRVTHPFHPLFGHEFELVHHRQCWGEDRVFYLDTGEEVQSLLARWTSAVAEEPFVVVSAERSPFRVSDLVELARLLRGTE